MASKTVVPGKKIIDIAINAAAEIMLVAFNEEIYNNLSLVIINKLHALAGILLREESALYKKFSTIRIKQG